jgi:hypothetical protein
MEEVQASGDTRSEAAPSCIREKLAAGSDSREASADEEDAQRDPVLGLGDVSRPVGGM